MKCPHCKEELGVNNICINPVCFYFGTQINSSEKYNLNIIENISNDNLNFNHSDYNKYDFHMYSDLKYTHTTDKDDISTEEFKAFIGKRSTYYYLGYIQKIKNNNILISWNWPCFLLGPYWLLYRKLYGFAAILMIFTISLSNLLDDGIPVVVLISIRIVLAMFANTIYLKHSMRKIKAVKSTISNLSSNDYLMILQRKGGVNLVAPLILLAVYILIIIIFIIAFAVFSTNVSPIDFSAPSYQY